jgi:hypothetical protein
MSEFKHAKALAKAKLGKEIADAAFRLVQLFLMLVLVYYLWDASGHWLGLVGMVVVGGILWIHMLNAPAAALYEFEKAYGDALPKWTKWTMWGSYVVVGYAVFALLVMSDPIIEKINELTHAATISSQVRSNG